MAKTTFFIFAILLSALSCSKLFDPVEGIGTVECGLLNEALVFMQSDTVAAQVNKLTVDLWPLSTDKDPWGQEKNLATLISRLNKNCPELNAERICYACIETNPPQSEILVQADSLGSKIHRVLDIRTPKNSALECIRVHEYNR